MNKEAMLAVADVIEYFDRFDMGDWVYHPATEDTDVYWRERNTLQPIQMWEDCGTAGCIAGWTCAWADRKIGYVRDIPDIAGEELGLTHRQQWSLFYTGGESTVWHDQAEHYGWSVNEWGEVDSKEVTAKQAADLLRRIAKGKVAL